MDQKSETKHTTKSRYFGVRLISLQFTNNTRGISSIGNICKLMPVKVWSDYGIGIDSHLGILYAAVMGADIINCSWTGVGFSKLERDVVIKHLSLGSLIIATAGNSTENIDRNEYSKNFYDVFYVGSSNSVDKVTDFSAFGVNVSVFCPGNPVWVTVPYNKYAQSSGTSLAAPIVSGVAGLIKSKHPDWTNEQIRQQIRSSADRIFYDDDSDFQPFYFGRVNAFNALNFNQVFDTQPSIPGVSFLSFNIQTNNGKIDSYSPVNVRLEIKNHLSFVKNLKIKIHSLDGLIIDSDFRTLEQLNHNETKNIDIPGIFK